MTWFGDELGDSLDIPEEVVSPASYQLPGASYYMDDTAPTVDTSPLASPEWSGMSDYPGLDNAFRYDYGNQFQQSAPQATPSAYSGFAKIPEASPDRTVTQQLKNLVYNKDGDNLDLSKIMKIATGLGGLYQSRQLQKNQGMTPTQLQAQLVQNNTQWTPAQSMAANKFFNQSLNANRGIVRAGESGIKSILPSRGYAEGGSVESQMKTLLASLGGDDGGVIPLLSELQLLGLPQGSSRIRVHGGDMAEGGEVMMAGPLSHGNYGLVSGEGDGQSDGVNINVSPGEYVFDAESVSMLGNGSNDAGADILDQWREFLREHKRSASTDEIGPESMDPSAYLPGEQ